MEFKGKIDKWWYVLAAVGTIGGIALLFYLYKIGSKFYLSIPLAVIVDLYLLSPFFCNKVVVNKDDTIIMFGVFKRKIPTKDIAALHTSRDCFKMFSASKNQIGIESHTIVTTYVGLEDEKAFTNEVCKLNRKVRIFLR